MKSHFEEITVADVLAALKEVYPQLSLDISCFMNELAKEDELMQSLFEDVLTSYDDELYREAYYGTNVPDITGSTYATELYQAINLQYPNDTWIMTGDYQTTSFKHEKREKFVLYEDEIRKAQFTNQAQSKLIEVEYKCLSNHKTDGIEIIKMECIR